MEGQDSVAKSGIIKLCISIIQSDVLTVRYDPLVGRNAPDCFTGKAHGRLFHQTLLQHPGTHMRFLMPATFTHVRHSATELRNMRHRPGMICKSS